MMPSGTSGVSMPRAASSAARLVEQRLRRSHLVQRRHERKHDAQRAVRGRAQQRPQLRLEDGRLREAEPDAAQPGVTAALVVGEPPGVERRVHQRPRELPLVDVERADRHRPRRHPLDELPVDVVLLVLGRHVRRAADEHELRSIEPDAFGAGVERRGDVVGPLDVRLQDDADAVRWSRAGPRRRARPARDSVAAGARVRPPDAPPATDR